MKWFAPNFSPFEKNNIVLLIIAAAILYWFFPVKGALDQALSLPWVDAQGHYYLRDNWWLVHLGHDGLKQIVWLIAFGHLYVLIAGYWQEKWRAYRSLCAYVLIAMILSTSTIGLLKSQSEHACPWNIVEIQHQTVTWSKHIVGLGKCFPGGHASAGFALIALYFAHRQSHLKAARILLVIGLLFGTIMSGVQMLRGAHFLSHNLWTLWWTWAIDLVIYSIQAHYFRVAVPITDSSISKTSN
ncbi:phosphatase PAP2 family protein [Acinetobacter brisouii]|uniref:phosphatase PAP2 family protein n=1 Tax=Acinetobacter brisouii TaxID=396323 RepID=UPI0035ADFA07